VHSERFVIRPGLTYAQSSIMKEYDDFYALNCDEDSLRINFQYSGQECALLDQANPQASYLVFEFGRLYFEQHPESSKLLEKFPSDAKGSLCMRTQSLLFDLVMNPQKKEDALRNIFLESQALSLLLCIQDCLGAKAVDCHECKFLTDDLSLDKIHTCRELIIEHMSAPLTIQELSRKVGMNQCYLKKGFKEVYGLTIFNFLQKERMQKARHLLENMSYTVAETAAELGYSSSGNFSTAFKKIMGHFPSDLVSA